MTVAIVQARLDSTRLPGKVMRLIGDYPAIFHTYWRVKAAVRNTVVAVPHKDKTLRDYLTASNINHISWDGPENDVLGRYAHVLTKFRDTRVVRITGDCPFIDPHIISQMLCMKGSYVTNTVERTLPKGLDCEIMDRGLLEAADKEATLPYDREHVTPWIREHNSVTNFLWDTDHSDKRWVLDTEEDLKWFKWVAERTTVYPPNPTFFKLLQLIRES